MSLQTDFNHLIKNNLINSGVTANNFVDVSGKDYYAPAVFNSFKVDMQQKYPSIYNNYVNGKGNELTTPANHPKMASVASSSRFCYLALKDADISAFPGYSNEKNGNVSFEFEKKLSRANPDAYYNGQTTDFYFEFKCQEFLDSILSHQYDKLLKKIGIKRTNFICDDFDAKQFITHLSGIVNNLTPNKNVVFSYVYFYPTNMPNDIKAVFDLMEQELKSVFTMPEIMAFCASKKITLNYYRFENLVMDGFENNPSNIKLRLSVENNTVVVDNI